jgi:RimJ/RimL family protein N-acetyltransferase
MAAMIESDRLPTLETPRLRLRWLTEADVGALFEIFSHAEVTRYWSSPPLADAAAAVRLLEKIHRSFAERSLFQWGIARGDDDRVIGTCTLYRLEAEHRRGEIGYALGRAHWGQGYMNEALSALLDFAFERLGLHRVEADTDPRNAASIRTLERLGFQREGYLRENWHVNGEIQDSVLFGLLRREWRR